MKNIRTISRGNEGISLQFTAKKSSSEITYSNNTFSFGSPITTPAGQVAVSVTLDETIDLASIAAGVTVSTPITFTGIDNTWSISASTLAALEDGLVYDVFISNTDEVTLRVTNITALPIDPVSNTWRLTALK